MNVGFAKNLLDSLICPHDEANLVLQEESSSSTRAIFEGELMCVRCKKVYFIKNGILQLLSEQEKIEDLMKIEIKVRDQQTNEYDQRLALRYQKEIPSTLKMIGNLQGKKIIEYGCGTGRVTEILTSSVDLMLAVDFSLASLKLLSQKLKNRDNIGLVWADAVRFKTVANSFDFSLAIQFYEHIPSLDLRQLFLNNVHNSLNLNGDLVMSVYHQDLRRVKSKMPKEGRHQSGIFFHYFSFGELKKELKNIFTIKKHRIIDISLPGEKYLNFSTFLAGQFSRFLEFIPVLSKFGHLLLIRARKK